MRPAAYSDCGSTSPPLAVPGLGSMRPTAENALKNNRRRLCTDSARFALAFRTLDLYIPNPLGQIVRGWQVRCLGCRLNVINLSPPVGDDDTGTRDAVYAGVCDNNSGITGRG